MPTLRMHLLGTFTLYYDDQPLPKPPTLKSQSLLAYLVCHRSRPQPRDRLVALFWGDRPERKARRSLTTALWHIRHRCLPNPHFLASDAHTVQFDPQVDFWLDVEEFEFLVAHDDPADLQSAVDLYRGEFMEGFYDDWVINERYRLEGLFFDALARLMAAQETCGEYAAALATALRLLSHDPLREDAHRLAMRVYCWLGQRNAALEQYLHCKEVISAELGAEPMAETTELYHAILEGHFAAKRAPDTLPVEIPAAAPRSPSGWSPLDVRALGRIVGRDRDLAFLVKCWEDAQRGEGGLVLVSGEVGIGKTRLAEEFAARLRWQGVEVLWGRCYEFERVLPYQPIAEALRTILLTLTAEQLAEFPAWSVAEVACLVPEVSEEFPNLPKPPAISPEQEQSRLFSGVARFLIALSSRRPSLVVVEDLHWASESTLQMLHYLARHLRGHPLLLLGTLRPEGLGKRHPLWRLQQQLAQAGLVRSWHLAPLPQDAVKALMVEMSGVGEEVAPLAQRLYREAEGNPFFIMEMIKALFEAELLRIEGGVWQGDFSQISEDHLPLPDGLSTAIRARVSQLSDETQEALLVAAVLGREFDFDLLNAVWGQGEEATLAALDEMLRHRLVDEGTGAMGRDYAFTHHKIQEALYAGIPCRRRQHTHAQAAAAMERLYRGQTAELAGEIAFHLLRGRHSDQSLTKKAVAYLLQAGDRARGMYAHLEAIDYYQQALELLKEQGAYGQAARTLMKLGLTHHMAFDFSRARQAYNEGFTLWRRAAEMKPATLPSPAPRPLRVSWTEPLTLDPALADDVYSASVVEQLFSGLVELTPEMDVVPDVARSWQVLDGGCTYIFHLRDDVCWSDGRPVTALDFEYAWKRLLAPATRSPVACRLFDLKGARAFHQGTMPTPNNVGVKALDKFTLLVELEGPTSYFTHLLTIPATYPVPRHVVTAQGKEWMRCANIVTNGPFRLQNWRKGDSLLLLRYSEYHGRFGGNVQQVELCLAENPVVQLEMYEANNLDVLDLWGLPMSEIDRVRQRHAGEYLSGPVPRTYYVGFHLRRPPFADIRVRQAFILAVDRERLAEIAMRGYRFPATGGFVPPGMPGHSPGIGLPYDPERARQLLARAGYPDGHGFPVVEAVESLTSGGAIVREYLRVQWREILGVEVNWESMEYRQLRSRIDKEPPHVFILSWGAAYPDPDFFMRVSPIRHHGHWQNDVYDRLVEQAKRVPDLRARLNLYRQADRMLMEEAVIMPLTYGRMHLLIKPWVSTFPTSTVKQWFWKNVVIQQHEPHV